MTAKKQINIKQEYSQELTGGAVFGEALKQSKEEGTCVRCQVEDFPSERLYIGYNNRTVCEFCIEDYLKSTPSFADAINNLTEQE